MQYAQNIYSFNMFPHDCINLSASCRIKRRITRISALLANSSSHAASVFCIDLHVIRCAEWRKAVSAGSTQQTVGNPGRTGASVYNRLVLRIPCRSAEYIPVLCQRQLSKALCAAYVRVLQQCRTVIHFRHYTFVVPKQRDSMDHMGNTDFVICPGWHISSRENIRKVEDNHSAPRFTDGSIVNIRKRIGPGVRMGHSVPRYHHIT